jgi:two-component system, response regulator
MSRTQHPILLVEDSAEDAEATLRAFKKARLANPVYRVSDGDEALDYLFRRRAYVDEAKAPEPSIVLLDLNLPGTDGREVLAEIKKAEWLRRIPVIVLTTSSDQEDIDACYAMGANSYIKKPVDTHGFLRAVQQLKDYWFEVVILPVRT